MKINVLCAILLSLSAIACTKTRPAAEQLQCDIMEIVDKTPGTVGVALVYGGDTITINNSVRYPMMSVFKLHQAIAASHRLAQLGTTPDTMLHIRYADLDPQTWSPMLARVDTTEFDMSARQLMDYALTASDNNASNVLFEQIATPALTDAYIRSVTADTTFAIAYSEAQMKADITKSYCNYTSPLAAALLIKQLYEDSPLNAADTEAIIKSLENCSTGVDRIGAALTETASVRFGHKTGSGYRNSNGELIAHNDVAYIILPVGKTYSLAVFIRDFYGSEAEASATIAEISSVVLNYISNI